MQDIISDIFGKPSGSYPRIHKAIAEHRLQLSETNERKNEPTNQFTNHRTKQSTNQQRVLKLAGISGEI